MPFEWGHCKAPSNWHLTLLISQEREAELWDRELERIGRVGWSNRMQTFEAEIHLASQEMEFFNYGRRLHYSTRGEGGCHNT